MGRAFLIHFALPTVPSHHTFRPSITKSSHYLHNSQVSLSAIYINTLIPMTGSAGNGIMVFGDVIR